MSKYLNRFYVSLFTIIFSMGFLWGRYFYFGEEEQLSKVFKKNELKLLIHENFLPDDILEAFYIENNVQIIVDTYVDEKEFLTHLKNEKYDIVSARSTYISNLLQKNKLDKLNKYLLKNKENISADFLSNPIDRESEYSLPVYWGITGLVYNKNKIKEQIDSLGDLKKPIYKEKANLVYQPFHLLVSFLTAEQTWAAVADMGKSEDLKKKDARFEFVLPSEGAQLWTENIAIPVQSENKKVAHMFVDFVLQKETAAVLAKYQQQSLTNKTIENLENIEPRFKPSYLRKVSISRIKYSK